MATEAEAFETPDEGTRSYYEAHANAYARETQGRAVPEIWDRVKACVSPGGRLLDVGCGAGRDLRHFTEEGYHAVGLDRSLPLARIARTFSGCPVVAADFRALPFRAHSFNGVYAIASLLHAERKVLPKVLLGIHNLLRPGGVLLATFKAGRGDVIDQRGRFTARYESLALRNMVKGAGLDVLMLEINSEVRHGELIPWLTLVARAGGA